MFVVVCNCTRYHVYGMTAECSCLWSCATVHDIYVYGMTASLSVCVFMVCFLYIFIHKDEII